MCHVACFAFAAITTMTSCLSVSGFRLVAFLFDDEGEGNTRRWYLRFDLSCFFGTERGWVDGKKKMICVFRVFFSSLYEK